MHIILLWYIYIWLTVSGCFERFHQYPRDPTCFFSTQVKESLNEYVKSLAHTVDMDWHDSYEETGEMLVEWFSECGDHVQKVIKAATSLGAGFGHAHEILKCIHDTWLNINAIPFRGCPRETLSDADHEVGLSENWVNQLVQLVQPSHFSPLTWPFESYGDPPIPHWPRWNWSMANPWPASKTCCRSFGRYCWLVQPATARSQMGAWIRCWKMRMTMVWAIQKCLMKVTTLGFQWCFFSFPSLELGWASRQCFCWQFFRGGSASLESMLTQLLVDISMCIRLHWFHS